MADMKKIATRVSYGNTLVELARQGADNLVVFDADLAAATKTEIFRKEFPDRHFDCGIAEQNMVGVAAGMSTMGYVPFVSSFAMFVAGRGFEHGSLQLSECTESHSGRFDYGDRHAFARQLTCQQKHPAPNLEDRCIGWPKLQVLIKPGPRESRFGRHGVEQAAQVRRTVVQLSTDSRKELVQFRTPG